VNAHPPFIIHFTIYHWWHAWRLDS